METHAPKNKALGTNKPLKEEFHFSGSGQYLPMTILASSQEEAKEIWLKTRKPSVGKVEEINQEQE